MAILCFSDVLRKVGLDPSKVKLIRHALTDRGFRECYKANVVSIRHNRPAGAIGVQSGRSLQNNEKGGRPESASPDTGRRIVRLLYAYEP